LDEIHYNYDEIPLQPSEYVSWIKHQQKLLSLGKGGSLPFQDNGTYTIQSDFNI